ncbi:MAG: hypothetical protein LBT04_08300 [Prevotellaceae bacterium]|jgi:hypothetical protein|nr:hypothetical protein [Prevotellaceae bacterium]
MQRFCTLIVLAVLLLQGCNLDSFQEDEQVFVFGSMQKSESDDFYIVDDLGKKSLLRGIKINDTVINKRFYIEGKMPRDMKVDNYDYVINVTINEISTIYEPLVIDNQAYIDSINNSTVAINDSRIIQTGKYLNLWVEFIAYEAKLHKFTYAINFAAQTDDANVIKVYLCHDKNSDPLNELVIQKPLIQSLDLTTIFDRMYGEEIKFVLIYKDYNGAVQEKMLQIVNPNTNR